MLKDELLKNAKTFYASASLVYRSGDYTGAFILFFKCLMAICDYAVLAKYSKTPKDHQERFRLLEKHFPLLYKEVDFLFRFYRQSYSTAVRKPICDETMKTVELYAKTYGIELVG